MMPIIVDKKPIVFKITERERKRIIKPKIIIKSCKLDICFARRKEYGRFAVQSVIMQTIFAKKPEAI